MQKVDELIVAALQGDTRNRFGESALMLAAREGQTEIVELLLAAGADPSLRSERREEALILASKKNHGGPRRGTSTR